MTEHRLFEVSEVMIRYLHAQPELNDVQAYSGPPLWTREDIEAATVNPFVELGQRILNAAVATGAIHVVPGHVEYDSRSSQDETSMTPDSVCVRFDLEPTDHCWRDNCRAESDPESETGLCTKCRTDLRSRWTN